MIFAFRCMSYKTIFAKFFNIDGFSIIQEDSCLYTMMWYRCLGSRLMRVVEKIVNYNISGIYGRLFWAIILTVTFWNIYTLFVLIIKRFLTNSVSIGIETNYLHWLNTFPAVSFCLAKNRLGFDVSAFNSLGINPPENVAGRYYKNLHDYLFTTINNIQVNEDYCFNLNSTCGVNITLLREQLLPRSCRVFMRDVSYKGEVFKDCEEIFKFHELDSGYCFLANNILDYQSTDKLPLKFEAHESKPVLKLLLGIGFIWKYEMYVHSSEEAPYFFSFAFNAFSFPLLYSYNIEEMQNDKDVEQEDVSQRNCLFPHEQKFTTTNSLYSFTKCAEDIRIKLELHYCNCTLFTSPKIYTNRYCDIKGILCLEMADVLTKAKAALSIKNSCLSTCNEAQITFVGNSELKYTAPNGYYALEIDVANTPSVRYRRSVTQSKVDILVSIGGLLGLFIGCSLINFVEFIAILLGR